MSNLTDLHRLLLDYITTKLTRKRLNDHVLNAILHPNPTGDSTKIWVRVQDTTEKTFSDFCKFIKIQTRKPQMLQHRGSSRIVSSNCKTI